ncbi:transposase [Rhodothermus marinus]|uniref:transposase n=1 Tax=Rhodothermus marinus TaxID=29549 RepID=UPI0037C93FEE
MRYRFRKPNRRSLRLKGYDYTSPGAYFVTLCTQGRLCLFGEIKEGAMCLNEIGHMIERWWLSIPERFEHVDIDAFVIMPNHLHGIIVLEAIIDEHFRHVSLASVVRWFKTKTTNEYIQGVKQKGWPPFDRRLWQRNYWEHIIRNDRSLERIRRYIVENPLRWHLDRENPIYWK